MPGMECWDGDYANAAGREKILAEITRLEGEMVHAKELYDELHADKEREATAARAVELADARDRANKLVNQIADADKKLQRL
jgi:chemotaxis regulatin CheY-phosphate phosphatase CheZ